MSNSNSFSVLFNNDITIEKPTNNITRKAMKKLRQISKLKKKSEHSELTPDELNKLEEEDKWLNILYPKRKSRSKKKISNDDLLRKEKQHQKFKIKELKREKLKRKLERRKKEREKKEKEAWEKYRKWKNKRVSEEREENFRRERKRNERREKKMNQGKKFNLLHNPNKEQKIILEEYNQLYRIHNSHDKVFRLLSKKFHPDRNRDSLEWAEKMQKELKNISVLCKC
jgi:hypothetical protein